jgi:hypothetical protein
MALCQSAEIGDFCVWRHIGGSSLARLSIISKADVVARAVDERLLDNPPGGLVDRYIRVHARSNDEFIIVKEETVGFRLTANPVPSEPYISHIARYAIT